MQVARGRTARIQALKGYRMLGTRKRMARLSEGLSLDREEIST